jgi:hypothetical protein
LSSIIKKGGKVNGFLKTFGFSSSTDLMKINAISANDIDKAKGLTGNHNIVSFDIGSIYITDIDETWKIGDEIKSNYTFASIIGIFKTTLNTFLVAYKDSKSGRIDVSHELKATDVLDRDQLIASMT